MKWAYQILTNDQGIAPGIHRVKTKKYATERAKVWAANGVDTRVLRTKEIDPADKIRGWEILREWHGITEADVIAYLDPSNDLPLKKAIAAEYNA